MRGLILAFGFLTRLPMPGLADFDNHWLAALLVVLVWVGITGALHLDGAADLADALGAAHRDPERFLAVMKDPHTGSFGVVAIAAILITKLVAVAWIIESTRIDLWALLLIPAWARLGAVYWSQTLDPLAAGSGESLAWQVPDNMIWIWTILLFAITLFTVSLLFAVAAVITLLLWRFYLKWRFNGMTGDCLGAGIEYCECAMLLAVGLL